MLDILRNRRSARKFTEAKIPAQIINLLQEALLRSPTSKNNRPWEFIFVTEPSLLSQLAQCKPHGAAFLKNAPLAVVIVANADQSDVWIEDCSIAAITLQYAAQSFDLGSCWVQVRKRKHDSQRSAEEVVQQILNLPATQKVASIIGIGYRAEQRDGVPKENLDFHKTKVDRYQ